TVLMDFVAGRWVEFGLGMGAAALVAAGTQDRRQMPFGLFAFVFLLAGMGGSQQASRYSLFQVALIGLGFFFLILQGARDPHLGGWTGAALRLRPLAGLGFISYSVYLLHQPLMLMAVQAICPSITNAGLRFAICLCVFVPVVV